MIAVALPLLDNVYRTRLTLISPPRTGSTPVARLLWQHTAITHHCHEPFEAEYWGGNNSGSATDNLGNPMEIASGERVPLQAVPTDSGLLIKEMSFQLIAEQFLLLARFASAPVIFAMRDPRLATTSRLRVVRELYGERTFPAYHSGWPSLGEQVELCRTEGIPYVLVDSADLRANPAGISAALVTALNLAEQDGIETWSPRPALQLCSPAVGTLMSDKRVGDDPFYRRVLGSQGIEPPDEVEWGEEERMITAAGLADEVAGWIELHQQLRQDPNLIRAE